MSSHRAEDIKGRAKEAVGAVTDNDRLRAEGRDDQTSSAVKRNVEKATDKVKDAAHSAKDKLTRD